MAKKKQLDRAYLRREKAKQSKVYQEILNACDGALIATGAFQKDEILTMTGYDAIAKSMRWDYIAEFLQADFGYSLIAVAQSFFDDKVWKKKADSIDHVLAGRYTATGHGKRTAGYALAMLHGGRLLLYRTEVDAAAAKGKVASIKNRVRKNIGHASIDHQVRDGLTALTGVKAPKQIASQ